MELPEDRFSREPFRGRDYNSNNSWEDELTQAAELTAAGLALANNLESGLAVVLPPGLYIALLSGVSNGASVGLVEVIAAADFIASGHEPAFASDLRAHLTDFEARNRPRTLAHKTKPGPPPGSCRCCTKRRPRSNSSTPSPHNFYRSNAHAMGEWKTASHVERQPKKKKAEGATPEM